MFLACGAPAELDKPNPPPEWPLTNIQIPQTVHERRAAPSLDNAGGAPDLPPPDAVPEAPADGNAPPPEPSPPAAPPADDTPPAAPAP
jgi:hypothetical protein